MIFLNPAVLFGLLGAAIPVLIHLLNLKKLKRIEFSTLAFLKELQKNKIRKLKLKQWLLLALRVMLILLIVLAFARPTLKGLALGGTTSAAKTTAVFIIDDTFSMSAVTPEGSYFNQAKQIAQQLLANLQEGDEAVLITVSANDEPPAGTGNLTEFAKKIKDLQISYASGTLDKAIINAAEVLGRSKNFNKELYIISDYQKGRISESGNVSDLGQLLNENVKVYAFSLPSKDIINLSIDNIELNTTIFEEGKPVSFNVTVSNNSPREVNDFVLSLFINGKRSAQQGVTLQGSESKVITIESPIEASGFIDVTAEIEDDDILQDNKRSVTFNIPPRIPVGMFASAAGDLLFISTALSAYENESKLVLKDYNLGQLSSLNPEQFSVIIICGDGEPPGIDRLRTYIENGGGVIIFPGEKSNLEGYNRLISGLGIAPAEGTAGQINTTESASRFGIINFEHPLFQNIFTQSDKKQIESPDIYYSFRLRPGSGASALVTLNNGSAFLSEYRMGNGKVLVFNSAPSLSWSNFPIKSIFPTLINRSVYYLSSKTNIQNGFIAGKDVNVYLGRGIKGTVTLVRPDKSEEVITTDQLNNGYFELRKTKTAGIYKFISDKEVLQQAAVNPDPRESAAEQLNTTAVESFLEKANFKGHFYSVGPKENPTKVIIQARFGSELWKYFIFAAIIVALLEMAVARNARKDMIPEAAATG